MDEDIDPEVVPPGPRVFSFRSFGAPWALFGLLGAVGAFGAAAVLGLAAGWLALVALLYRWLWNLALGPDVTRWLYGSDRLAFGKALASVLLFVLVSWLVSPKKS